MLLVSASFCLCGKRRSNDILWTFLATFGDLQFRCTRDKERKLWLSDFANNVLDDNTHYMK